MFYFHAMAAERFRANLGEKAKILHVYKQFYNKSYDSRYNFNEKFRYSGPQVTILTISKKTITNLFFKKLV